MIRKRSMLLLILFLTSLTIIIASTSEASDVFIPWDFTPPELTKNIDSKSEMSIPAFLLEKGFVIFSQYISPVDGDRCNMYPTCAAYARESVVRHGFILGLLLTVDRLIHESNEMEKAPLIKKWDRLRYYDPVSNNDFWWYR